MYICVSNGLNPPRWAAWTWQGVNINLKNKVRIFYHSNVIKLIVSGNIPYTHSVYKFEEEIKACLHI